MAERKNTQKSAKATVAVKRAPAATRKKTATSKTSAAKKSSKAKSGKDVVKLLTSLGISPGMLETMAGNWKNQLSSKVTNKIEETDLKEAFERAREVADGSVDSVKKYSKKNPTLFFSGLAAVLMGAGLLAAAGREATDDEE